MKELQKEQSVDRIYRYAMFGDVELSAMKARDSFMIGIEDAGGKRLLESVQKYGQVRLIFQAGRHISSFSQPDISPTLPICICDIEHARHHRYSRQAYLHFTVKEIEVKKGKQGEYSGVMLKKESQLVTADKEFKIVQIGCFIKMTKPSDDSYLKIKFSHMLATFGVTGRLLPQPW